ncbi:enoyl-CoA hydratase-related protein [Colwellia psychrerythraea]|uniref:Enoyl-CoA hydratase/isomerase n=1 Tax=Colwellia psychrerythraea TaxID=28229 RepID=A0A099L2K4_COLPS|nr:enoyl-CoA hydratase-related protein [Colwellia psychrerythraea]KGJ96660.1 Enoyl-CoA hydratase/isomerase [Colwellia psychrerythraea]
MSNLILTTEKQGVFTITLNRTDKKNALTNAMYQELCRHFAYANETPSVHCLVIQGNENCFCAGNDLHDFMQCSKDDDLAALEFVKVLSEFTKPLVAGVAGVAVGIGTTLLLHCDMVIAANNSLFKLPFTQLGLCPEAGSSLLLTQKVGQNKAFELMVLGTSFNAEQALNFGIANQTCQPEELLTKTNEIALAIARLPVESVMTSRRLIRQGNQLALSQVIVDEGQEFVRLVNTDECKNILAKFFK